MSIETTLDLLDPRLSPERISAWIAYFKHWREDSVMKRLTHPPVQQALGKLRSMSADEEARYWAEAREKATLLDEARAAGLKDGRLQTAQAMLKDGEHQISAIAQYSGLSEDEVRRLADSLARH